MSQTSATCTTCWAENCTPPTTVAPAAAASYWNITSISSNCTITTLPNGASCVSGGTTDDANEACDFTYNANATIYRVKWSIAGSNSSCLNGWISVDGTKKCGNESLGNAFMKRGFTGWTQTS